MERKNPPVAGRAGALTTELEGAHGGYFIHAFARTSIQVVAQQSKGLDAHPLLWLSIQELLLWKK